MVNLCGEKGLLLVHALHFSAEFTHDSTLFSTCHNRRSPGSRKCHSERHPYLDAYSAVLKQDVSGRNAVGAIRQRHVVFFFYSASASHPTEMKIHKQLHLVHEWLFYCFIHCSSRGPSVLKVVHWSSLIAAVVWCGFIKCHNL